jgi:hypothetical protein
MGPLTKAEVLEKYRDVIGSEDFEFLLQDQGPAPAEVRAEGAEVRWLGSMKGFHLFLKRKANGALYVLGAIAAFEGTLQHVERLADYVSPVAAYLSDAGMGDVEPADTFILGKDVSPQQPLPNGPAKREYFVLTATPTGTSTPVIQFLDEALPPGSGVIPASRSNLRLG